MKKFSGRIQHVQTNKAIKAIKVLRFLYFKYKSADTPVRSRNESEGISREQVAVYFKWTGTTARKKALHRAMSSLLKARYIKIKNKSIDINPKTKEQEYATDSVDPKRRKKSDRMKWYPGGQALHNEQLSHLVREPARVYAFNP